MTIKTFWGAAALALSTLASGAHAASFDFSFSFDGTNLTNTGATVGGTSVAIGDDVTLDFSAASGDSFTVLAGYAGAFVPHAFAVNESGQRIVSWVSNFYLDGSLVNTLSASNEIQDQVHIGAHSWTLAEGFEFDQVVTNSVLDGYSGTDVGTTLAATGTTFEFFKHFVGNSGAFIAADSISYGTQSSMSAVPLPAGGLLLLTGLMGIAGLKRRNRLSA